MDEPSPDLRVGILEDDARTRRTLATLLDGSPGFAVAGAYPRGDLALQALPIDKPDVLLVDLELPGMNGVEFMQACRRQCPGVECVVLTLHDQAEWVFPALAAGARGYLVKGLPPATLLEALLEIRDGGSRMSSQVARLVMQSFHRPSGAHAELDALSARELEVLQSLSQGLRYAEIAERLGVSRRTINTHLYRIYNKLHVNSAAGAVGKLLRHQPPPPH